GEGRAAASGTPRPKPGAHGAPKHAVEQQQHETRHEDPADGHHRVAQRVPDVAAEHGGGVANGEGERAHAVTSCERWRGWPVRARKTSSRSGSWTVTLSAPGA